MTRALVTSLTRNAAFVLALFRSQLGASFALRAAFFTSAGFMLLNDLFRSPVRVTLQTESTTIYRLSTYLPGAHAADSPGKRWIAESEAVALKSTAPAREASAAVVA
jgi:hypothetical protein